MLTSPSPPACEPSPRGAPPSPPSRTTFVFRRGRLGPKGLNAIGAACGGRAVRKVTVVQFSIIVAIGEFRTDGQPARTDRAIPTENVQPANKNLDVLSVQKV